MRAFGLVGGGLEYIADVLRTIQTVCEWLETGPTREEVEAALALESNRRKGAIEALEDWLLEDENG